MRGVALLAFSRAFRALAQIIILSLENVLVQFDEARVKVSRHNVNAQVALIFGRRVGADFDCDHVLDACKHKTVKLVS